ncbi:autophagy-related protein [Cylindrobasidium torrendii FP15055 ss-10]|uniref:Autophagy protein 5 n=1 Tax=Cylindrobasidium torrendii FP15055 ss-10 TaxID=1314674 RepID=A0A0D7B8R8_9AGAR|nr:autophagy-related protein [Cylindrobasidium torrendii FP15055 ss-10]
MSTYGTTRHNPNRDRVTDYHTTLFRRLIWDGTVPLEIRINPKHLPANSERALESYFIQAPRVSYLPLVLPEIRRFFADLVFDETGAKDIKDEDWWFENTDGVPLKWHWPLGLIYDNFTVSQSAKVPNPSSSAVMPMRLILHLASPPTDKLLLSPSQEACKQAFMGQLKEADFIRWGNTKRITGLRQPEQDGLWEGIREHNFDDYWRVASKITPASGPHRTQSPAQPPNSVSMHTRPPSAEPTGAPDKEAAYNVRNVPVRVYLPDGPVLQGPVPPMLDDAPNTLANYLSQQIPLLFPPRPPGSHHRPAAGQKELAHALIQGVPVPLDSEMAWLGVCMAGADGWVNICVGLNH